MIKLNLIRERRCDGRKDWGAQEISYPSEQIDRSVYYSTSDKDRNLRVTCFRAPRFKFFRVIINPLEYLSNQRCLGCSSVVQ